MHLAPVFAHTLTHYNILYNVGWSPLGVGLARRTSSLWGLPSPSSLLLTEFSLQVPWLSPWIYRCITWIWLWLKANGYSISPFCNKSNTLLYININEYKTSAKQDRVYSTHYFLSNDFYCTIYNYKSFLCGIILLFMQIYANFKWIKICSPLSVSFHL